MKIVFDNIIYSIQRYGGISVVWNNLVSRIIKAGQGVLFIEYDNAEQNISRNVLSLPRQCIKTSSSFLISLRRYLNPSISRREVLPGNTHSRFIFHSSYFRICNDKHAVNITTVHDFTYELFVHNWLKRTVHCRQKHAAIRKSQRVVCISENTRRDLLRFLPDIDPAKVRVIYNGVEDSKFHVIPHLHHQDYAIFVGRRDDYKNFDAILQPLAQLHIPLCIVGSPLNEVEIAQLDASGVQYEHHGLVTYEELNRLYNQALFLFYPSRYEGFGLPILEAQMAGCPVLAYNSSCIPEVIGDPTLMLNQITADAIAPQVARFRDPALREQIIADGLANARRFTWDRMAAEYLALYEEALNTP